MTRPASPTAAAAARQTSTRWPVVVIACVAGIVTAFQIGKVPVALPTLSTDLGLSRVGAAWVIAMFNLLGAICGAPIGAAIDRVGVRRSILGGLTMLAAAGLAGAVVQNAASLLATRFLEGCGFICVTIAAPGLIVRASDSTDQRLAFGLWSCYLPIGSGIMLALAPPAMAFIGWRGLWLANCVFLVLTALAVMRITRDLPPSATRDRRSIRAVFADLGRTLRCAGPMSLAGSFTLYALQYMAIIGFLPTLLIQNDGLSASLAGLLTSFAVFANATGNLVTGWLLYRGVPSWLLLFLSSLLMAVTLPLIFAPLPFELRYGATLAFCFVSSIVPTAVLSSATRHAPTPLLVNTTIGIINQGSNIGQMGGPPAIAKLADLTGSWAWSPVLLVPFAVIGIVLSLVLRRLDAARGVMPLR